MAGVAENSTPSISVDEHLARILEALEPLDPVSVPIVEVLGRTLAVDAFALVNVPSFDNSAMDGYAVRRSDLLQAGADAPVQLRVVGDIPAGSASNPPLGAGQAARIMTGAPIPDDADSVVPVELTDAGITSVQVTSAPQPAAHIRRVGADILQGELVLPAGRTLRATDLAAATAAGLAELTVLSVPRVGILSTGDELRPAGEPLGRGQIHDSNSVLLAAAVTEAGGTPVIFGAVPDDNDLLYESFKHMADRVDVFVTSGGVSVGAYDVVKAVLQPLGVWFGPVRMQPGKPQGFGRWQDGTPIFTLPGNPVSVFVSFETFVRPSLLALQGRTDTRRPVLRATAGSSWSSPAGRTQYMPAVLSETSAGPVVNQASHGGSGSHLVTSLARANALAIIPEDVTSVEEGQPVDVVPFGGAEPGEHT